MEQIPDTLNTLIEESLQAVDKHPQHDLPYGYRVAIWDQLGPLLDKPDLAANPGHRRRLRLNMLAVEKVLPQWQETYPGDNLLHQALELCQQALAGMIQRSKLARMADDLQYHMYDLADEETLEMLAGFGAVNMVYSAAGDIAFDADSTALDDTDEHIEPAYRTTEWFAATVYAGGEITERESNPERRKEFWVWWLTEAVPTAYREGST